MPRYHLFLSYSRRDNVARAAGGLGWVTAFHNRLLAQHQKYSGRGLQIFFDKNSIDHGADWQRGISEGLRHSALFIAFLSENYIRSEWCRREWEEYLRLEHTLARGDDGILPIFFEMVPSEGKAKPDPQTEQQLAAWIDDIMRRNQGDQFKLVPWFAGGPEILRELDVAERLADLRAHPQADKSGLLDLAGRVEAIDHFISRRLDRATLAELAPGNLDASYSHFVGRHRELRLLHSGLIADKIGLVGQGKTALAIQYAYAYAEHYAAGGRWFLPCEGKRDLAEALEPLLTLIGLQVPKPPETLSGAAAREFTLKAIFAALKNWTHENVTRIEKQLSQQPELHTRTDAANRPRVEARLLLILDNVSEPTLLSAGQLARMVREDWFQVIATTRLDPHEFGGDAATLSTIPVDDLPEADALALIAEFQPEKRFASAAEEAAAREIVRELGGFTLAIELVAAYLQAHARDGATCVKYLAWLRQQGVTSTDQQGKDASTAARVRYGEESSAETETRKQRRMLQVGVIVRDTLEKISSAARHVLTLAALLPPDLIVVDWLHTAGASSLPTDSALADPWLAVLHELLGRRLLVAVEFDPATPARPRLARLHRLVGEHLLATLPASERAACAESLIGVVFQAAGEFQDTYQHDPAVLWLLRPLEETVERLWREQPQSRELALAAGIAATAEFETGQLVRAGRLFQRSLTVREELLRANPQSAQAARDVSLSLEKKADFLFRLGQSAEAAELFKQVLPIREMLLAANPGSAEVKLDVAVARFDIGEGLSSANRDVESLLHYQQSARLFEELVQTNPNQANTVILLTECYETLGNVSGGVATAAGRAWFEKAWSQLEAMRAQGWSLNQAARKRHERLRSLLGR
jgi:tetratricopeptide (TPR) repeat protein